MSGQDLNLYAQELRAMESATEQLFELVKHMADRSHATVLRAWLTDEAMAMLAHGQEIATFARHADSGASIEPCEAMQCMIKAVAKRLAAASRHGAERLDQEIIAECQQILRYETARLGAASGHARVLEKTQDADGLSHLLADMQQEIAAADRIAAAIKELSPQLPESRHPESRNQTPP
jgi:ferritin-like metal-binding protein YciE